MTWQACLRTLCFAAALVCVQSASAQTRAEYPDAAKWEILASTKVGVDSRGAYTAAFPPAVLSLANSSYTISGYMLPVNVNNPTSQFVLSRFPLNCPFCDPSNPNENIEVNVSKPVALSNSPVTVSGRFALQDAGGYGMFFRLDNASVTNFKPRS